MPGGSMKDIKANIKSVGSTMQITKALELVATSKLHGAREQINKSRPFFKILKETLDDIIKNNHDASSVFTKSRENKKPCYIVIAGDRGLAGGYNNNIFKLVNEQMDENAMILPIGKKAIEYFSYHKRNIITDSYHYTAKMSQTDCYEIGELLSEQFKDHKIDSLSIVYTRFVSVLTQEPVITGLLPLEADENSVRTDEPKQLTIYEPSPEALFHYIVPQYIGGMVYGAVSESAASECAARRVAMESASNNAEEIIKDLKLRYNRLRQAAITQELTEIMSGADMLTS